MYYDIFGQIAPIDNAIAQVAENMGLPERWNGFALSWKDTKKVKPIFIGHASALNHEYHLFGVKHDMSLVLADGMDMSPGYFIEYRLVEKVGNGIKEFSLMQSESVFFPILIINLTR